MPDHSQYIGNLTKEQTFDLLDEVFSVMTREDIVDRIMEWADGDDMLGELLTERLEDIADEDG